ncbi:MAG TPA: DUF4272 domain-containing protein [Gemmatimonadaceae bacterium]|nr:DUF4272 domain-containing protein [Gemmatimonadaceae bacterium]
MIPYEAVAPDARTVAGRALILHYEIERIVFTSMSGLMSLFAPFAAGDEMKEFSSGMTELGAVTIDLLKSLGLWRALTPRERRIFESGADDLSPEDQRMARQEADALVALLWALGRLADLPESDDEAEGSLLMDAIGARENEAPAIEAFLEEATLRPEWEIAAARDALAARLRTTPPGHAAAATVLTTRLKALDWICGSLALSEWDSAAPTEL